VWGIVEDVRGFPRTTHMSDEVLDCIGSARLIYRSAKRVVRVWNASRVEFQPAKRMLLRALNQT